MKRALTTRGFAMLQAGTYTLEQLMADPKFSVEVTDDMKVTNMTVGASVVLPSETEQAGNDPEGGPGVGVPADSGAPDLAAVTAELDTTKTTLADFTAKLETANTQVTELTAQLAQLTAQNETLNATLASARPLMESAVNGLQVRLKGGTADLKGKSEAELVSLFGTLSTDFKKAFPTGQVSVVDLKDDQNIPASVPLDNPMSLVLQRANSFSRK